MCKKLLFLVLAGFCLISSAHAATIIWVSNNKNPAAGVAADQGWVDLLTAQGYTVDLSFRNREGRMLDDTKIAALNAADLIIVSRDTSSGEYDDGSEPSQWNSITTPILMQVPHIVRSSHWRWLNTTSTNDSLPPAMVAVEPGHYVFKGVTLDASNQVSVFTIAGSFASTTAAGNGRLIAKRADNDQVWIVEWQAGQEFYSGSGQTAAGPRMLFSSGTNSGVDGRYNLTPDGEKIFLNAVRYMLGERDDPGKALEPNPADAQIDVPRDVVLSWTPGKYAPEVNGHIVYLSENFNDVNDGIGGVRQSANSFAPP